MYKRIDDMGLSIRTFEVCKSNSNQDGGLGQMQKCETVLIAFLNLFGKLFWEDFY